MAYTKEQKREYARRYRQTHPDKKYYHGMTCDILKQHHEAMKEDPEHLTTEFIKKLIKVDCKDV